MKRVLRKTKSEPTIALINIVFLMLIFFMVSGTLARPLDASLSLVRTADLEGRAPPDALMVHADGRLTHQGQDISAPANYLATLPEAERQGPVRLIPDRELPAADLVRIAAELRAAGAGQVMIVTERGLE
ncbi:biopolymer transport protein ExbD [Roseovarius nanhaiticus]|uniref:Biopolymer transport protein ExbD n=1 Tax=Roseovarius nanhaiticus TaxID=573024 RepID=A0A1N7F4F0_9RHOB|nr:biopolymer transporter ExbD [Roseovarius nanhaiticus]SEK61946.1 biopolymer transport protein ExbD [Roseovarius nanhaiticus]SIR95201.1 biopolymer transport protein ExbD [Roseovarius nanhaiticus]